MKKEEKNIETEKTEITETEEKTDFRWYAVRIISGHENKVKSYLDSNIKSEGLENKINNV
ncbi:MAG: hypothetical protein FJ216_09145, partial [Ignavibacteria bacterium]|nr:hypothetical protein [Ignavibacteria bacterium]